MRVKPFAFVVASFLLACNGAGIEGLQASSTGTTTSAPTTTGGAVAGPPSCTFSVSGAVDLAGVALNPFSNFILGPNMFQCGTTANGSGDRLVVYLGADVELGLGSFSAPYAGSYNWQHCDAEGCTDYENDGSPYQAGDCAVEITVAPAMDVPGQPIAGTFSCTTLVQGADPTQHVSLAGSFSLLTEAIGATTGAGGSATVSTGAGGSSSGTGGAGGAKDSCSISVTGAIDIAAAAGFAIAEDSSVSCSAGVLGAQGWFNLDLGTVHGPGSYPLLMGAGYELSFCALTAQGCTDVENFIVPPDAAGCSAEITVAPHVIPTFGQPLAGSFSCPILVDKIDPGKSVAVSGSFALVMQPPPD